MNSDVPLGERLADVLPGATRFDVAAAYVKRSGVQVIQEITAPPASRFLIGTGFALTDPDAVEWLDAAGAMVRVVVGSDSLSASAFHPKLYLVEREDALIVFAGSGNLTSGGLDSNVEQYEELWVPPHSELARAHRRRYESLWNLGDEFKELKRTSAWSEYAAWAARKREREREDLNDDARSAARLRARLRRSPRPGSLGEAAGDDEATLARLAELLSAASGVEPVVRGRVYAMLTDAIGTETLQRAGLEMWGDDLVLAVWPGELKDQAQALYRDERASGLLAFVASDPSWRIKPNPHLAFRFSDRHERLYSTTALGTAAYVEQWRQGDIARVGGYRPEHLRPDLWPWLLERGYAAPADDEAFERFLVTLRHRQAHLRPGLQVWRTWPRAAAEELDSRPGALASEIRQALGQVLAALGEPALP